MPRHSIYENLARVRRVSIGEAERLFPTVAKVQEAYGVVLVDIWSGKELQDPTVTLYNREINR